MGTPLLTTEPRLELHGKDMPMFAIRNCCACNMEALKIIDLQHQTAAAFNCSLSAGLASARMCPQMPQLKVFEAF